MAESASEDRVKGKRAGSAPRDYWADDRAVLWHPYTNKSAMDGTPFPMITRGEGPYLYDSNGVQYLDAISSWWCCNLGHGHPRLVRAIKDQADQLQHSILGNLTHPRAIELADKLVGTFPDRNRRVFFSSDGASAVEAALKIAVQYWHNIGRPERCRFISLSGAYHGDTLGAMSVGFVEDFHKPFKSIVFKACRAEAPFCAECRWESTAHNCNIKCLDSMKALFKRHSDKLAAVIVEPLCRGAAGMRIYSPKYLKGVAELCRNENVPLIVDEIATGMGRTGKMYAFEHAGIDPDIVCVGKGLSAGYLPISAVVVKNRLYDTFADVPADHTFYHGHTFAGNPIACAAALETLAIYEEEKIVERAARLGKVLGEEVESLRDLPGASALRHLGMIAAVDVAWADKVRKRLWEQDHILIRPLGRSVYLMLPLIVDEAIIRSTVGSLRNAIAAG